MGIEALRFLVGRWRGEGTLRGRAVTSHSECVRSGDGSLRLDVETRRDGEVVHRESVAFRATAEGGVAATTSPRPGTAQAWEVEERGARLVLRHPGFRWEVAPDGERAYDETFDAVAPDGRATRIVALRHTRLGAPRP